MAAMSRLPEPRCNRGHVFLFYFLFEAGCEGDGDGFLGTGINCKPLMMWRLQCPVFFACMLNVWPSNQRVQQSEGLSFFRAVCGEL